MTNNPNELTIENSVLVLIDHQPWIALMVHSIDPGLMINNVAGLAQAAKNLGVPTILTTIGAKGSILVDPLFKEITEIFPGRHADRPHLDPCLVAPGVPGRDRCDGPQEVDHGRLGDRGLPGTIGARRPEGRIRGLFRQRLFGRRHGRGP